MQDRVKNGLMNGVELAQETAFNVVVAAVDPQLANYKVAGALTLLGGLACYYRNTPYVGNFLFFSEIVIGTGLFLNQHGVKNSLVSCMTPVKSAYQSAIDNGTALYRSYVPSVEEKPVELKIKKSA